MLSNIESLKIRNARQKLLQRFDFLDIMEVLSSEEENGKTLFADFVNCGIWDYANKPIASFPFHDNGQIDKALYHNAHQKARAFFI